MELLGESIPMERRHIDVVIGTRNEKPLVIKIFAPRLSAVTDYEETLKPPPPPEAPATGEVKRDKRKQIVKDEYGRPIVDRDFKDPAYLKALHDYEPVVDKHHQAQTVALLLECLGEQARNFKAQKSAYEGRLVDYYLAIWKEFEDMNIDMVSLSKMSTAALQLTGLTDSELNEAEAMLVTDPVLDVEDGDSEN